MLSKKRRKQTIQLPILVVVFTALVLALALQPGYEAAASSSSTGSVTITSGTDMTWDDGTSSGSAVVTYGHVGCESIDVDSHCDDGVWYDNLTALSEKSFWVWTAQNVTEDEADNGSGDVTFTKTFNLPANAVNFMGDLEITADNIHDLKVNGATVTLDPGESTDWKEMQTVSIGSLLVPGGNTITIVAENEGNDTSPYSNPGGIIFYADITYDLTATAVDLVSFTAEAGAAGNVALAWETAAEIDNAGFNLYRASSPAGPFVQINDGLIAAQGSPDAGATYSFTDSPGAGTFYYQLEDVETTGVTKRHGPVSTGATQEAANTMHRIFLPTLVSN